MINYRALFLAFFLISVMLSGCTSEKPPLTIGIIGTMTGANSDLSVSGRRGVEVAMAEINEAGGVLGRQLQLKSYDDENVAAKAMAQFEACNSEGNHLVIGPFTSGMITPNADAIETLDLLVLAPTISADILSYREDNIIRFIAATDTQAEVLVNQISRMGLKSFAVVSDRRNAGFTDALVQNVTALLQASTDISPQLFDFNPEEPQNTMDIISTLKADAPEGVLIIASAEDVASMAQVLHREGLETHLFAPLWANTPELIRKGGDAIEGIYIVGGIDLNNQSERYQAFENTFVDRYGDEPTFASLYAYETMQALAQAIEHSGQIEPEAVKEALLEIGTFDGLQSTYTIDANGDSTRDYDLFQNIGGNLRKVY